MSEAVTEITRKRKDLAHLSGSYGWGAVCAERCTHGFDVRERGNTLMKVTSYESSSPFDRQCATPLTTEARERGSEEET